MFLLLINSLEDEGGRMQTSLFHYSNNLALKNSQKCMNTISFFSELVPWPKLSRCSIIELELMAMFTSNVRTLRNYEDICICCTMNTNILNVIAANIRCKHRQACHAILSSAPHEYINRSAPLLSLCLL